MPIYNKLVRDNIPKIIEDSGQKCMVKKLDRVTYIKELKIKLKEEVSEYLESKNNEEAVEELADVLEIIHALAKIHDKDFDDVEAVRQDKKLKRGGFKEQLFLVKVDE